MVPSKGIRPRKIDHHHVIQPDFRQVGLGDEADAVNRVFLLIVTTTGLSNFRFVAHKSRQEVFNRRINKFHQRNPTDVMIKPMGEWLKGKVGGEVAKDGDGIEDDGKPNTGIW